MSERTLANYLKRRDREISKIATVTPMFVRLRPKRHSNALDVSLVDDNDKSNQCDIDEISRFSQPFTDVYGESNRAEDYRPSLSILKQRQFEPEIPNMPTVQVPKPSTTIIRKVSRTKVKGIQRCERCKCSRTACKTCKKRPLSASADGSLTRIKPELKRMMNSLEVSKLELNYIKNQFSKFYEDRAVQSNPVLRPSTNPQSQHSASSIYKPSMKPDNSFIASQKLQDLSMPSMSAKVISYPLTNARIRPSSGRHRSALIRVEVKIIPKTRNFSEAGHNEHEFECPLASTKSARLATIPLAFYE